MNFLKKFNIFKDLYHLIFISFLAIYPLFFILSCHQDTKSKTSATNSGKMIFVSAATKGQIDSKSLGITALDSFCQNDINRPLSTTNLFKALIADSSASGARTECISTSCSKGGKTEHVNWVLSSSTQYIRPDGTVIGTTDENGLLPSPLTNSIGTSSQFVWTGISSDHMSTDNCSSWTKNGGAEATDTINGAQGDAGSTTNAIFTKTVDCNSSASVYCVEQ